MPHSKKSARSRKRRSGRPSSASGSSQRGQADASASNQEVQQQLQASTQDVGGELEESPIFDMLAELDEVEGGRAPVNDYDALDEAEMAEGPNRDAPGALAQEYIAHIQRSDEIFEQERKESTPYVEDEVQRKNRHGRNHALKRHLKAEATYQIQKFQEDNALTAQDQALWDRAHALHRWMDDEYAVRKERDPDTVRRAENKALKQQMLDDAKQEFPDDEKEAKTVAKSRYYREKQRFGGAKEKTKANADIDKMEMKARNKQLFAEIEAEWLQAYGGDEKSLKIARPYIDAEYEERAESTDKQLAKKAKKEAKHEAASLDGRRKKGNQRLKKQIGKEFKKSSIFTRGRKIEEAYAARKEQSAPSLAKKERKAEASATRGIAREMNSGMRQIELEAVGEDATSEERLEAKRRAAKTMIVVDDKTRRDKNKALAKVFSREEYRELKVHRSEQPDGGGGKNAFKDPKMLIDALGTGASMGNKATALGVKHFGGEKAQETVLVDSVDTDGFSVRGGGTSMQAGGILTGVAGTTAAVNSVMGMGAALTNRSDPDPSVRALASREVVKNAEGLVTGSNKAATGVLTAIKGFHEAGSRGAENIQLDALPVFGLVGSAVNWLDAVVKLGMASGRAMTSLNLSDRAERESNEFMEMSLVRMRNADLELIVSKTMDIASETATIVQHTLTLSGVGAPIAAGIKSVNSALGAVRSVSSAIYQSEKARAEQRANIKFHDVVERGQGEDLIQRRGKKLLRSNIKFATQEIINASRDGDPIALDYLQLFGMGTADLSQVDDKNLRKLILNDLEEDENKQTLGQQLNGVGGQVRGVRRAVVAKFGDGPR